MAGSSQGVVSQRQFVDTGVQRCVLDTAGLAPRQALALWQENIGLLYDVRLRNAGDDRFHFHADAFHFGEIVLTSYRCIAQSFDRSRARIGRDGLDHITVQVCLRGSHGRRDGASDEKASSGDLIVADLAQAQSTGTSDFDSLNLTMPRRLLAPFLKAPDEHNMRVISGNAPLAALLGGHLVGLYGAAPAMSRQDAEAVIGPTLELAAAAVNARLSAETAGRGLGLSPRYIRRLFAEEGQGFSDYVMQRRLERVHRQLASPLFSARPIADLAFEAGLVEPSTFYRQFRSRYGMTPSEVRAGRAP
ncbi:MULTISPECIES: AraC family transcriptional regulator [unclassified Mesorhizobium]|uniref:helix-turn-helix domain-containing protein n=1 Tax=unclassified Mesorhizobium TaxID=325217 RepID=UPI00112CBB58|nr:MULTISPECIES: AraC family transcriptional regulator [unclassified Mesorhizobium]TPM87704.1 helix-turn-helix domain-containing protein [Mesorhizobium sp. B2-1-4]